MAARPQPRHMAVAEILRGVYAQGDTYPDASYGGAEQGYGVPAFFFLSLPMARYTWAGADAL